MRTSNNETRGGRVVVWVCHCAVGVRVGAGTLRAALPHLNYEWEHASDRIRDSVQYNSMRAKRVALWRARRTCVLCRLSPCRMHAETQSAYFEEMTACLRVCYVAVVLPISNAVYATVF